MQLRACAAEMETNLAAIDASVREQMAGRTRADWIAPMCRSAWRLGRTLRAARRRIRPSDPAFRQIRLRAQAYFDTRLPVVQHHLATMNVQQRLQVRHCLAAVAVGAGGRFPAYEAIRRQLT